MKTNEPAETTKTDTVGAVDKALALLNAFGHQPSISVKEGAEMLGVAPSTAYRLLATLQVHGYVGQDNLTKRYWAGSQLIDVALGALKGLDIRRVAHGYLEELSEELRETVNLAVLDKAGLQIRFLDSIESPEAVRVSSRTGTILPAHCTAVGKVLLSGLTDEELRARMPSEKLVGLTALSVNRRSKLIVEIEGIRQCGYAANFGESTSGLSAIGVPITDPRGFVVAAIGVSAPANRIDEEQVVTIVAASRLVAAKIQSDLYHRGATTTAPEGFE